MAKLNKQKFNLSGFYEENRTTSHSPIELFLYYETDQEYFYFDQYELEKYFKKEDLPSIKQYFGKCDTKAKAIEAMKAFIVKGGVETKFLAINLGVPDEFWKVPNPKHGKESSWGVDAKIPDPKLPNYLIAMLEKGRIYSDNSSGLTLDFERIIELKVNGAVHYAVCDENWNYNQKYLSGYKNRNLIEWTETREKFLIDAQLKINSLCQLVLNYFNAGDDVEKLFLRMESNTNLLLGEGDK